MLETWTSPGQWSISQPFILIVVHSLRQPALMVSISIALRTCWEHAHNSQMRVSSYETLWMCATKPERAKRVATTSRVAFISAVGLESFNLNSVLPWFTGFSFVLRKLIAKLHDNVYTFNILAHALHFRLQMQKVDNANLMLGRRVKCAREILMELLFKLNCRVRFLWLL